MLQLFGSICQDVVAPIGIQHDFDSFIKSSTSLMLPNKLDG